MVNPPPDLLRVAPSLVKMLSSATEVPTKTVTPPFASLPMWALLLKLQLPAVASLNTVVPPLNILSPAPPLFVKPTPVMYNVASALLMVNALAPELNTIPFTCVRAEAKTPVTLEVAKVATSAAPFGGPPAVQLAAVFQSPLTGFIRHVALSAK